MKNYPKGPHKSFSWQASITPDNDPVFVADIRITDNCLTWEGDFSFTRSFSIYDLLNVSPDQWDSFDELLKAANVKKALELYLQLNIEHILTQAGHTLIDWKSWYLYHNENKRDYKRTS